jgi:hypothetical protein
MQEYMKDEEDKIVHEFMDNRPNPNSDLRGNIRSIIYFIILMSLVVTLLNLTMCHGMTYKKWL